MRKEVQRGLFLGKLWNIHFQVKHWSGIAVKMEEPASLAAFVPARNPSLADIVNTMNGRGKGAHPEGMSRCLSM